MMPFFLTMPISRMMPIDRDHAEIEVNRHQQQQRADAGRRQRRQDRDRMDRALVEHAEDDVDDDERRGDQERRARQRRLEGLRVALEAGRQRGRLAELLARSAGWRPPRSPIAVPGSRLNEMVTDGNWP